MAICICHMKLLDGPKKLISLRNKGLRTSDYNKETKSIRNHIVRGPLIEFAHSTNQSACMPLGSIKD